MGQRMVSERYTKVHRRRLPMVDGAFGITSRQNAGESGARCVALRRFRGHESRPCLFKMLQQDQRKGKGLHIEEQQAGAS